MAGNFSMDGYVPVAERISAWYEAHPDGRIVADPPTLVEIGDRFFVASTARAYRSLDDTTPCQGSAWEPYPGPTQFTKDSEAQNAETSAVGRALALAGVAINRGFASREEVRNRQPDAAPEVHPAAADLQTRLDVLPGPVRARALKVANESVELDFEVRAVADACKNEQWVAWWDGLLTKAEATTAEPPETYPPEDEEPF